MSDVYFPTQPVICVVGVVDLASEYVCMVIGIKQILGIPFKVRTFLLMLCATKLV